MDEIIYSEIIYKYSFNDAIKDGYICDYFIYLPYIENNKVIIEQPEELLIIDENICKKCLFLINGLLRTGCRRTIIYLKCKDECELYEYVLNYIMDNYHYYKINIRKIISDTNKKERVDILNWFEENNINEEIRIILSIRILDEGINLIKCDSIYLTNLGENSNDVRTVQRFLRANRKDPNNVNKLAHIFIWCDDTYLCMNSFQILKNNDINFNKKIKIMDNNYGSYYRDKDDILTNIDKYDINSEIIKNINIKCLTFEELWNLKKNILFEYCDINKIIPLKDIIYRDHKIGYWYRSQKKKIIKNISNNTFIYNELIKNTYIKNDISKYIDNEINKEVNSIEIKEIKEINKNVDDMLSFIDFLKKNSNVPYKFIDDFFSLINYNDLENNEKIVDLDKVIEWLYINKGMFKKTLTKSYKIDIDYIIKKVIKPNGKGGQKREIILLTFRCFKKICQLTRSKNGNNIRDYFIDIEYTTNKYKNYIIDQLSNKLNII